MYKIKNFPIIYFLGIALISQIKGDNRSPPPLFVSEKFKSVLASRDKYYDYSKIHKSHHSFYSFVPSSEAEAIDIIQFSNKNKLPIRLSGAGHSLNGFSLPKKLEILINTSKFNGIRLIGANKLRVGSGVNIWRLNHFLNKYNLKLPIINGGGSGPTVGGFISAGGISFLSKEEGGFWENVYKIRIITADGRPREINRGNKLFPWLFGSMGQLGLITEAILKLSPLVPNIKTTMPVNQQFTLASESHHHKKENATLFWFNLFSSKEKKELATSLQKKIKEKYNHYFSDLNHYMWKITFKNFTPPLLFNKKEDFYCIGIFSQKKEEVSNQIIKNMYEEFFRISTSNGFRGYIQSELNNRPIQFKELWGSLVYEKFKTLKKELDPNFIFNRGSVFNYKKEE